MEMAMVALLKHIQPSSVSAQHLDAKCYRTKTCNGINSHCSIRLCRVVMYLFFVAVHRTLCRSCIHVCIHISTNTLHVSMNPVHTLYIYFILHLPCAPSYKNSTTQL